jgi:hypothetical protein
VLDTAPTDRPDQIHDKERALAALNKRGSMLSNWKCVADLWCGQWFGSRAQPSSFHALSEAILGVSNRLPESLTSSLLQESERLGKAQRFFHWELEFPEIFFDSNGERVATAGFDAVIGNPPWEMLCNDQKANDADAHHANVAATVRFAREAGVYACQTAGHPNQYQLFLERAITLVKAGGRLGLVLPWGLAVDHGSADLRRLLLSECDLRAIVAFENRARLFPIHRSVKFVLITAARGRPTEHFQCYFGAQDTSVLDAYDPSEARDTPATVSLTPALLERLSGRELTIPDVRTPTDLGILERCSATFPALSDRDGWHARFGRELNASDDRERFHPHGHGLPVVEGKAIDAFRVRLDATRFWIGETAADTRLGLRHRRPRLAYRDVASATNRRTLIAAVLPAACVSTHTLFCLRTPMSIAHQHTLCALFNSFVVDYLVRMQVTTHVTTAIVERLPVPGPHSAIGSLRELGALARLLSRRDDKATRRRLDVLVGRLFQLSPEEFEHVLSTFPLVPSEERNLTVREFAASA